MQHARRNSGMRLPLRLSLLLTDKSLAVAPQLQLPPPPHHLAMVFGWLTILLAHQALALAAAEDSENPNQAEDLVQLSNILDHEITALGGNNMYKEESVNWRPKRDPFGINGRGFHEDVFSRDFGNFKPYKKNILFNSDGRKKREVFFGGVAQKGESKVLNKRELIDVAETKPSSFLRGPQPVFDKMEKRYYSPYRTRSLGFPKRRPNSDFHEDAFTQGFGDFSTMRKRRPSDDFHGNTFTEGFGDFETMKRRPSEDFHGDVFTQGFGDFATMRKRKPASNFHDDIFTQGFGDFDTMRKRRPSDDFHGDTFTEGFGDFQTMRKRRPNADFHDDIFTQGFGDFDTMRKRRPSDDFYGDTFTQGFGNFETMKKRRSDDNFHGNDLTEGSDDSTTMMRHELPTETPKPRHGDQIIIQKRSSVDKINN